MHLRPQGAVVDARDPRPMLSTVPRIALAVALLSSLSLAACDAGGDEPSTTPIDEYNAPREACEQDLAELATGGAEQAAVDEGADCFAQAFSEGLYEQALEACWPNVSTDVEAPWFEAWRSEPGDLQDFERECPENGSSWTEVGRIWIGVSGDYKFALVEQLP